MDSAKGERWIEGGFLAGEGRAALRVLDGRIAGRAPKAPTGARVVAAHGHWLAPMLVDAHVHLAFAAGLRASDVPAPPAGLRAVQVAAPPALVAVGRAMIAGGVCGALDLGAPEPLLAALGRLAPLRVAWAGPLLCAPGGYPTQSWGAGGYGLEVRTPAQAREAVARLAGAGARLLKLSFDARFPLLPPEVAAAAAKEAHARKLRVAAHALDAASVQAALQAGADVLAHTPTAPLPAPLIEEAGRRGVTVLSTLHAFGGGAVLLENLARLRAAGARVIYGTDLGNQGTAPGVLEPELRLLLAAGLSPAEVLRAATRDAAELVGEPLLGTLDDGAPAHLLALSEDPLRDPTALCRPAFRLVFGVRA